jgi:hypothetical protein
MLSQQRSILAQKVKSAEQGLNPDNDRVIAVGERVGDVLHAYFHAPVSNPTALSRIVEMGRLLALPDGGHYLFRVKNTDIHIAFNTTLIGAAADVALNRPPKNDYGVTTSIDRAIAAALARRIALAVVAEDAAEEIITLQYVACAEELRFDKSSKTFELFEWSNVELGEFQFRLTCAIAAGNNAKSKDMDRASQPGWDRSLQHVILNSPVTLRAELGMIETNYSKMLNLSLGDILSVAVNDGCVVRLRAPGAPVAIAAGRLGSLKARRAVRLDSSTPLPIGGGNPAASA